MCIYLYHIKYILYNIKQSFLFKALYGQDLHYLLAMSVVLVPNHQLANVCRINYILLYRYLVKVNT